MTHRDVIWRTHGPKYRLSNFLIQNAHFKLKFKLRTLLSCENSQRDLYQLSLRNRHFLWTSIYSLIVLFFTDQCPTMGLPKAMYMYVWQQGVNSSTLNSWKTKLKMTMFQEIAICRPTNQNYMYPIKCNDLGIILFWRRRLMGWNQNI